MAYKCKDCAFYREYEDDLGICHRYPEAELKGPTDFCGEFMEQFGREQELEDADNAR